MSMSVNKRRNVYLGMMVLLLVTMWLGVRSINADILFVDEYWSIRNSGGDPFTLWKLSDIWERTATVDPGGMGVLYHWLLNAWGRLIGWSIYSIRVFSLLAGLLAIAMVYRLGSKLFNRYVGWYAAAALGFSAFFIDYLHEARAYTLLALFVSCTIYAYARIMIFTSPPPVLPHCNGGGVASATEGGISSPPSTKVGDNILWYIALSLSLAALAYTHYVALAMGIVLGVYHLTQFRNDRRWWAVVAAMALGGLLFLPWLGVTIGVIQEGTGDTNRQATSMNALQIAQNLPHTFSNANLALLGLLLILALRERTKSALLVWTWLIVAVGMAMLVNAAIPFMVHLRYLMMVFPAFALLVGLGIWHTTKMGLPPQLLLGVWIAAGIYQSLNPTFIDTQFGQIYRAPADGFNRGYAVLQERAEMGDMALFHIIPPDYEAFNLFVLGYYFNPHDEPNPPIRYDQFERMNNSDAPTDNTYLRAVWDSLNNAPAVWTMRIPELPTTQYTNVVNFALDTAYSRCETVFAQDDMVMELHARTPDTAPDGIFTQAESVQVELYNLQRGYQDASTLHVVLGFESENLPTGTYSVGVHLLDDSGNLVAQFDTAVPDERPFGCIGASLPLKGLASGEYTLQTVIYDRQTGERLLTYNQDALVLETVTLP